MYRLIPINSLRNAALVAAETPLVLMADADLVVSASLSRQMANASMSAALVSQALSGSAVIVPTFETNADMRLDKGQEVVARLVVGTKADITDAVKEGSIYPFAEKHFYDGHKCTRFDTWYNAGDMYNVDYTPGCEPWYIADRLRVPEYDVRYRGYGWNKVQQVAHASRTHLGIKVHPDAFMLHRPHLASNALEFFWREKEKGGSFFKKITGLYQQQAALLEANAFVPRTDERSQRCRRVLPWWQVPQQQRQQQ